MLLVNYVIWLKWLRNLADGIKKNWKNVSIAFDGSRYIFELTSKTEDYIKYSTRVNGGYRTAAQIEAERKRAERWRQEEMRRKNG